MQTGRAIPRPLQAACSALVYSLELSFRLARTGPIGHEPRRKPPDESAGQEQPQDQIPRQGLFFPRQDFKYDGDDPAREPPAEHAPQKHEMPNPTPLDFLPPNRSC